MMYLFTEHAREDYQMFRYLNDTDSKSAGLADYDMEDILKLKVIIGNFYVQCYRVISFYSIRGIK